MDIYETFRIKKKQRTRNPTGLYKHYFCILFLLIDMYFLKPMSRWGTGEIAQWLRDLVFSCRIRIPFPAHTQLLKTVWKYDYKWLNKIYDLYVMQVVHRHIYRQTHMCIKSIFKAQIFMIKFYAITIISPRFILNLVWYKYLYSLVL